MSGKAAVLKTSDGAVGTSGEATILYGINIKTDGETGGVVVLRNGTSTSGTAVFTFTGTAQKSTNFDFGGNGVLFPDGLFYDEDANVTSSTVIYEQY